MENIKNIFVNKEKAAIYLSAGCFFVFIGVFYFDEMINFDVKPLKSIMLLLGLILFSFGIIHSIYLLSKKSPMLIVNDNEVFISIFLKKDRVVKFEDIESFFLVNTYHRGFVTNRIIFVELKKPSEKYSNSLFYKILKEIIPKRAVNSEFSIQTAFLDIKCDELLKILNKKLRDFNKSKN
ncbi:STM3941 family protein [Flavobacterium okayamense]|uniref:PH domain-containing protein n=1 Tax=Flavobacterium okayamense TaxID=2830782 RepID=A0ABM7S1K2_9FLAO|nr:STM3941 family protein [Flavobacterium okayamense]BCY27448.1 hypothetical protein KK2020170_03160 [Flavobacterium okayamense]